MKKIAALIFALLLCLPNINAFAEDEMTVDFQDDFEAFRAGDIPGAPWTFDTQNKDIGIYAEVDTDPTNPDNKALRIQSTSSEQVVWATCNFGAIGGKVRIEYKAMLEADSSEKVLYPGVVEGIGNLMTYQGGWVLGTIGVQNLAPTTMVWHDICFELDFTEKRYTLFMNGDVVMNNYPLSSADQESVDKIQFGYGRYYIMIDDLKVSHAGNIEKSYTKIQTDGYHYNTTLRGLYNIPYETEPEKFLEKITFVEDAVYGVYEADGETPYTKPFIEEHSILKIQSPDLKQELRLGLHVRPWVCSLETARIAKDCIIAFDGSPYVIVNNKKQFIDGENKDIKSFSRDGKMLVPLRKIAESLGAAVDYNSESRLVTVNGKAVEADMENIGGRSFISAEALAELLDKPLLISENDMAVFSKTGVTPEKKLFPKFISELYDRR